MFYFLVVLQFVTWLAAGLILRATLDRFERVESAQIRVFDDEPLRAALEDHTNDIADIFDRIRAQNVAIAEGIERTDRAERRVRSAVARARARMADLGYTDDGLEAEAEQLHLLDGAGGQPDGVPPVHANVAQPEAPDMSAFPGQW